MSNQPSSVVLFKRYIVNSVIAELMDDYNRLKEERDEAYKLLDAVGINQCKDCKKWDTNGRLKLCRVCEEKYCPACTPLKRFYLRLHICKGCQLKCIKEYGYCTICYNFKLSDECQSCFISSDTELPSEISEESSEG